MILFKQASQLRHMLDKIRKEGGRIGFVPTMGALHQGHISLLEAARKDCTTVVCSIFVNPTQFNDPADFEKYPITLDKDIDLLHKAGTNLLFLPSVLEIYPEGSARLPTYDIGFLETIYEGAYRPGHFQGVCQVMERLLSIVGADELYMGQKDFQQCMVVKRLLEITRIPTRLNTCPTLREASGLAMSSRNTRLSEREKSTAAQISETLNQIRIQLKPGSTELLLVNAKADLEAAGFGVDYISIASASTLQPITVWDGTEELVALAAAYLGDVRLIDNMLIHPL